MCQAESKHLLRSCTEKKKNTNLCQAGTSCPSQEFIPQVIRDFAYFVFMCIKLIFFTEIFALNLSSLVIVRANNFAIS